MESALRPRDIQSRIRGGESAEHVAAAAQTTVEAIMAFAAPVLAERAHMAQTALKSSIRRATSEASPVARTLDDASRQYLTAISVRADDVEWDAWRRDDGRWSVVAEYIAGDDVRRAEFSYDQPGRYVLAENDEARLLTGETAAAAEAPEPGRRLSAVPNSSDADELPLGDDALELVRERDVVASAPEAADDEGFVSTSDLTETVAAVREAPVEPHADADWIASVPSEPAESSEPEPEEHVAQAPIPVEEPEVPAAEEPAASKKKGRSSVPSWDEIMFGGGKHE